MGAGLEHIAIRDCFRALLNRDQAIAEALRCPPGINPGVTSKIGYNPAENTIVIRDSFPESSAISPTRQSHVFPSPEGPRKRKL